jgi:cytochrome c oxidase cbb3-type subunit 3
MTMGILVHGFARIGRRLFSTSLSWWFRIEALRPGGTAEFSRGRQPTGHGSLNFRKPRSGGGERVRQLRRRYAAFAHSRNLPVGWHPRLKSVAAPRPGSEATRIAYISTSMVALACLLTGCDFPGRPNPSDRPVRADEVVDFARLFQTNCAGCHGAEGKLGPAPPLNDAIFLSIVPDAELLRVITEGRPGTPMAAFSHERGGPLTDAQVKALATGLKSRWKAVVDVKVSLPPYLAPQHDTPTPSTESLAAGATAFARACAVCHGENGEGASDTGAINDPAFLGLISDQALRRLIITGRPDLGMPNFADGDPRGSDYQPLSSAEIDEVVALLAAWRQNSAPAALDDASQPLERLSADGQGRKP